MVGRRRGRGSSDSPYASSSTTDVDVVARDTLTVESSATDSTYERTFLITRADDICAGGVYRLRHPRAANAALYHITVSPSTGESDVRVAEVLRVDANRRSMFFGETVVDDGSILLLAPVHPLFLVLPYILKAPQQVFLSVDDLLEDSEFPAVRLLAASRRLHAALRRAADAKELLDDDGQAQPLRFYRHNETRLIDWLVGRFDVLLRALLADDAGGELAKLAEEDLRRYTFGVLCDWLPAELVGPLKIRLFIQNAIAFAVAPTAKRVQPAVEVNDENVGPSPAKTTKKAAGKPITLSKRMQQAIKGTKSISAFFDANKAE